MFVAVVRTALRGMRGCHFRVAIFAMRAVAMIARHRDGNAGTEAEKTASDTEKLRAHHRQHAESEQEFFEM